MKYLLAFLIASGLMLWAPVASAAVSSGGAMVVEQTAAKTSAKKTKKAKAKKKPASKVAKK